MKKHIFRVEIPQGRLKIFPYGVAYWDMARDVAVCYPIPLHWLIGLTRKFYHMVSDGVSPTHFDMRIQAERKAAYEAGWKAAMKRVFAEMEKM